MDIKSVLIEGGADIFTSFLKQSLWDRCSVFVAPKILGDGISFSKNLGISTMKQAMNMEMNNVERMGDDLYYQVFNGDSICLLD
jgi:diaminohydroxyphosphoribosylaminopyrimidine deaminase/5-amino-6-(5-phosphoribosylamino)uracil reductase